MDQADYASDLTEQFLEDALKKRKPLPPVPPDPGLVCIHCFESVPLARQKVVPGVKCCIDCQQLVESGQL